jgi:hypothetical protein
MGVAAPQAHTHDLFGAGNRRREWVIPTHIGVTEEGTLLFTALPGFQWVTQVKG